MAPHRPGAGLASHGGDVPLEQGRNRLRERAGRGAGGQLADAFVHGFRDAARGDADHRQAAGHGLQHHQAEGLGVVGVDEGVTAGEQPGQARRVALIGQADHIGRRGDRARPRPHQQQGVGIAEGGGRLDQDVDLLFPRRPAGEDQQPAIGGEAEAGAQALRVGPARLEDRHVDAQRQGDGALDSRLAQTVGDIAAGCDHLVELAVDLGPASANRPLGPVAEMQRRQGRQVGVAEADDGGAEPLARLQRRQARGVGVARLDQAGPLGDQPLHPGGLAGRPAVAVAEGQRRGVDRPEPLAVIGVGRPRHDQTVAHPGPIRGQPGALGEQVAFHPAGAWRIEHGGVDQAGDGEAAPYRRASPDIPIPRRYPTVFGEHDSVLNAPRRR